MSQDNVRQESIVHMFPWTCKLHYTRAQMLLSSLGLYRGQPILLSVLWRHEGLAHSELAAELDVTPATITKMLQRMEQAGFVSRRPDPDDQRISRVYLTDKGREIRAQVDEVFRVMEGDMLAGFTDTECEQLRGFLSRIRTNLEHAIERVPEIEDLTR